jgi:hypothetical protein
MAAAHRGQMVLFQEDHFDLRVPVRSHDLGTALGIALPFLVWLPIALLLWMVT